MKNIILFLFVLVSVSNTAFADTLVIPPSALKTKECKEIYPLTKIGRDSNQTCYVYATINLPHKKFVTEVNIRYEALDSTCILQSELRSLDLAGNNSIITVNTRRGLTAGIENIDMEGYDVDDEQAYMLSLRLMNHNQCYIYGIDVKYDDAYFQ